MTSCTGVANVPCIREPQRVDYLREYPLCVRWFLGTFVPVTSIEEGGGSRFPLSSRRKSASIRACYPVPTGCEALNPWVPGNNTVTHTIARTRPARPPAKGRGCREHLPRHECSFNVPNVRPYPKTLTHPRPYAPRQLLGPVSLIRHLWHWVSSSPTGRFVSGGSLPQSRRAHRARTNF